MKRILVLLIGACMGCSMPAHAGKPTQKTVKERCGPSGLIQVFEAGGVTFIRLQKGCYTYRDDQIVGFESGDDEILTANEAGRYELPFPGAYFYFQENKPRLSYLAGGQRRKAILAPLKSEGGFTYSAFLGDLRGE